MDHSSESSSERYRFWLHYSINSHTSLYLGMLVSQAQRNAYKPHAFYWRFVYIHFIQHAGHEKPRTTNVEKMRKRVPPTMQCCNLWVFKVSYYISIWTTLLYYILIVHKIKYWSVKVLTDRRRTLTLTSSYFYTITHNASHSP